MTPKFLAIAALLLLSACAPEGDSGDADKAREPELVKGLNMPEGLKDCKTFRVYGEHDFAMLVTRCPHSDTTTRGSWKNAPTSVVANDEEEQDPAQ